MSLIDPVIVPFARDVVEVAGPDAATYLQGQVSQDVEALGVGESAWSLLLAPQGKVEVWFRLTRLADDRFVCDTDAGWGDALVERLERFKLRVDAAVTPLDWVVVSVRGPGAADVEPRPAEGIVVPFAWGPLTGIDALGSSVPVPDGLATLDDETADALRIEAGFPQMGRELTTDTIPEAAGVVASSVSFTKGCYVGQELVARIDSRGGNVPTRLRLVRLDGPAVPDPGAPVLVGDDEVGEITSAATAADGTVVALAYLRRSVEPPVSASVLTPAGVVDAAIEVLPDGD